MTVVVLAGGTGGAKLARGMADVAGDELVVVANTGDDVEIHGVLVSPDPDLVTFWLADRVDARGWGLAADSFTVMDELRRLGDDVWFALGDRDLALGLRRARRLAEGATPTEVCAETCAAYGVRAQVLPMADTPVRTRVRAGGRWWPFQEFMIRHGAQGPVEDLALDGVRDARPPAAALEAIAAARAIVVGPSNPLVSIGPILAVPGLRDALREAHAPIVAVSPIVGGAVLKGPTAAFLTWAGHDVTAAGVAASYAGLLDGMVCDEEVLGLPVLRMDTRMDGATARRRVAEETLRFAAGLGA